MNDCTKKVLTVDGNEIRMTTGERKMCVVFFLLCVNCYRVSACAGYYPHCHFKKTFFQKWSKTIVLKKFLLTSLPTYRGANCV